MCENNAEEMPDKQASVKKVCAGKCPPGGIRQKVAAQKKYAENARQKSARKVSAQKVSAKKKTSARKVAALKKRPTKKCAESVHQEMPGRKVCAGKGPLEKSATKICEKCPPGSVR